MTTENIHTFAIGDVHGRADLLEVLLAAIKSRAEIDAITYRIVFLGDIIDRGDESCRAMELVVQTLDQVPGSTLILGNHEWLMLRALDEANIEKRDRYYQHWAWECGGVETLSSYGGDWISSSYDELQRVLKADHIKALRQAAPYVELEHHILVHAGMKPSVPLLQQDRYDLMWIREPFLIHSGFFEKNVIHGHTPTASGFPERHSNRIAIDVAATSTEVLVAAHILPNGEVKILEAYRHALGFVQAVEGKLLDMTGEVPSPTARAPLRAGMQVYVFEDHGSAVYFARMSDGTISGLFHRLTEVLVVLGEYERRLGFAGLFYNIVTPVVANRRKRLLSSETGHRFVDAIQEFLTLELVGSQDSTSFVAFTKDGLFVAEANEFIVLSDLVFAYEQRIYGKDFMKIQLDRISRAA